MKNNHNKKGQAIAEYLILTALIAIASIGIIQVVSVNLRGKLNQVNSAVLGERRDYQGHRDTSRQTQMIDMGNFQKTMTDVQD
jgi:Flp pilus assembly pilin Flp